MEYVNNLIEDLITTDVDALKYEAIKHYMKLINDMQKGTPTNLKDTILEIISLIDIYSVLDKNKLYKEYYLNIV